ncbi:glycerol-3-phosphate dehydrogenase subunit GlpB [Solirubrobacter taibaiensis]|nr:glycerol-3-phosphate dehydrogenase subunit GlpB [Solirubrobacter taibaiensis]
MSHHDVIVIGVGLAGLVAAVRLAEAGARVLVVAKGIGATHLSPCTIDVLGYAPERVDHPLERLPSFLQERPGHPYGAVGAEGIVDAVDWLKAHAPGYSGSLERNFLLPTALGVPRPTAVVPATMAHGDLRAADAVAVVGFSALKDFHPALLADGLRRLTPAVEARPIELDLVPAGRADVSSLGYARAFDDPDFRARVVTHLGLRLRARERVAFPAVLGVTAADAVWTELEGRLGHAVFEIPTLPPSVPGIRLHRVLSDALRRAGGTVRLNVVATGAEHAGSRVTALRVRSGLRVQRHGADWIVVASGGFASGGLELRPDGSARETALGLPVTGVPSHGAPRFAPEYFARHPVDQAGVAVDGGLRPLDGAGGRVYENVLVAGATLAGCEPWREKSGDGISLATGYAAAGEVLGR